MVGFMVMSGQMQQTMKQENSNFGRNGMSQKFGVLARDVTGDGDVTGDLPVLGGGKGKDIGGNVFAAKVTVEAAHLAVGRYADVDLPANTHGAACSPQKGFDFGVNSGMVRAGHEEIVEVPGFELSRTGFVKLWGQANIAADCVLGATGLDLKPFHRRPSVCRIFA